MAIFKTATALITPNAIHNPPNPEGDFRNMLLSSKAAEDIEIRERFTKIANKLKIVSPKAKDFLYFSAVMLHSAERSLIDDEGNIKKDAQGNPVTAEWKIDKNGSWKWVCSDPNIKPYKNNNLDVFPEPELKKAYRKWIGRPLCKDHQSSSVDGVRGIIVDTYYDDKFKRVIGLCALDKVNYPDLARKVATGYIKDVSMGTGVGKSICYDCGNPASVESEYCNCVKTRNTYGEINVDLNPIELSLVVTGADPLAKLRTVIASLQTYSKEKEERIEELQKAGCVSPAEIEKLATEVFEIRETLKNIEKQATLNSEEVETLSRLRALIEKEEDPKNKEILEAQYKQALFRFNKENEVEVEPPYGIGGNKAMTGGRGDSSQNPEGAGPPKNWSMEGREVRLSKDNFANQINKLSDKLDTMQKELQKLANGIQITAKEEERNMSDAKQRAKARRELFRTAYHQGGGGVNDPATLPYPVDPTNDKLKTDGDKQMEGQGMEPGADGLHPGYESFGRSELELKKMLSRAELEERKLRRHAFLSEAMGGKRYKDEQGQTYVETPEGMKKVTEVSAADDELPQEYKELLGLASKKAYHLGGGGVNDPSAAPYPVDPMNDKLKTDGDKQMEGQGMEPGADGLHPGYQSYGNELALKKKWLRAGLNEAKLRAKFKVAFTDETKKTIDKKASRWEVYANDDLIISATGEQIFEDMLDEKWEQLASKEYGKNLLAAVREKGLVKVNYLLTGENITKTAQPPMPGVPDVGEPADLGGEEAAPMPEMGEEGEKEDLGADPMDTIVSKLDEALVEAEKALGDLKDLKQEKSGQPETELPSPQAAKDKDEDEDEEDEEDEDKEEKDEEKDEDKEEDANDELYADDFDARVSEVFAGLERSADELAILADAIQRHKDATVRAELVELSKEAMADYQELKKQAALLAEAAKKKEEKEEDEDKEDKKDKKDKKEDKKEDKGTKKEAAKKKEKDEDDEEDEDKEDKKDKKDDKKKSKAQDALDNLLQTRAEKRREMVRKAMGDELLGELSADDEDALLEELKKELEGVEDRVEDIEEMEEGEPWHAEDALDVEEDMAHDEMCADDTPKTASARKAWREKVAAEYLLKLEPQKTVETDLPPNASHTLEGLDTKTTGDGAEFEGIVEQHDKILKEIYNLPKVREAMDKINSLMKEGKLNVADLDDAEKLTALAVDPEAAKYWKQYFGEGDQGSKQFGAELTKEFNAKKASAALETREFKTKRAYDLALEMQEKGMIGQTREALHAQVDQLVKFNDELFDSFKKAVNLVDDQPVKTAGLRTNPAVEVGINQGDEEAVSMGIREQLKRLW